MRVEHIVICKLHELTEEAQDKAHEEYLERFGWDIPAWREENRESLEEFCKVFPVKAKNWSYGYRTDITSVIEFSAYDDDVWDLTGLRLRTWLINNFEEWLYKGKYIHIVTNLKPYSYKSKHSKAIIEPSCCPFTGYCMDENLLDPIRKFIKEPDGRTLEDLLNECLWSWVNACQEDYEYEMTFEFFKEHAEANEWEFYQNGKMI